MDKTVNPTTIRSKKIIATHPVTGTEKKFDRAIYQPIKAAILQSLKGSKGKTFTELSKDVEKIILKKWPDPIAIGIKKSISWYTITIRLDLETKGVVESFVEKGKKLNRLKIIRPVK